MQRILITFLSIVLAASFSFSSIQPVQAQPQEPKVIGYFVEWGVYARDYHVSDIPVDQLTHINYGFAKVENGQLAIWDNYAAMEKPDVINGASIRGNYNQLVALKAQNPHLKTLISVGGWSGSADFSAIAANPEARKVFAQSALNFIQAYGFDGVDIDWEYPVIGGQQAGHSNDRQNFTLLMRDLREALGNDYLLTAAVSANPAGIDAIEYHNVMKYLDWVNVMTYDFHGYWDTKTAHHTALYNNNDPVNASFNLNSAIEHLQVVGVPSEKIVPGAAFYGRSFAGVQGYNGLHEPFVSKGPGTFEQGILDYKDIDANYLNHNGYIYFWDNTAQAAYLFNPDKHEFITFDDKRSVIEKSKYVLANKLGGLMFWELSGDNGDLLYHINKTLRNPQIEDSENPVVPVTSNPPVEQNQETPADNQSLTKKALETKITVTSDWKTGYCADVMVKNNTSETVEWVAVIDIDGQITSLWNARFIDIEGDILVEGESWNEQLKGFEKVNFGYCAKREPGSSPEQFFDKDPATITTPDEVVVEEPEPDSSDLNVRVRNTSEWFIGYCANVTIKNPTDKKIDWEVSIPVEGVITHLWNAQYVHEDGTLYLEGEEWNNFIDPDQERVVGFCLDYE